MRFLFILVFVFFIVGCQRETFNESWTKEQAPDEYHVLFETSKGEFLVEVKREYSPKAADRFYQLVKHNYFDNGVFYRVVKGYVAQFGNTDLEIMEKWRQTKVPDEEVKLKNTRGTLSFAQYGKESRDLEVFINLKDNPTLDTVLTEGVKGFPAFGKVVKGMEVVDKLNSRYGDRPMQNQDLYSNRRSFYRSFPDIDKIIKAELVEP